MQRQGKMTKLFLISLMFLLSINLVFALDLTNSLMSYYSFDGTITTDDYGSNTLTDNNAVTTTTGKLGGQGLDCNGADEYLSDSNFLASTPTAYTVNYWARADATAGTYYLWHITELEGYMANRLSSDTFSWRQSPLATGWTEVTQAFTDTASYHMFTQVWNGTSIAAFKDNAFVGKAAITNFNLGGTGGIAICGNVGVGDYYNGKLDEWGYWQNKALNYEEINALYNSGTGCNPVDNPNGCGSGVLVVNTDMVGDTNYPISNLFLKYNGTLTASPYSIFNCTLQANGVLNMTDNNVNLTLDQNFTINFGTAVEKDFYLNITCINGDTQLNDTSNTYLYRADTIKPTITSGFVNNSVYTRGLNTMLNFTAKYYDTNLYAVNTTICKLTGTVCTTVINNTFNTALTPTTKNHTIFKAISGFSTGRYFARAVAWDSHTASLIEDYKIDDLGGLFSDTGVEIEDAITLTSADIDTITMEKSIDRYSYDVELKEPKESITFKLQSTGKLDEIENSEYLGHFVDFENKKWIDFESEAAQGITYNKISDYEYDVIVDFKKPETSITFNSIGDLNQFTKTYFFNVTNGTTIYARNRFTNARIANFTVKVFTYPSTLVQLKSTNNYNITFNLSGKYYFNLSSSGYVTNKTVNYTFTDGNKKTVYLYTSNSILFYVYNEQTNRLILDRNTTINLINYAINSTILKVNGTGVIGNLPTGDYEISYKANNFTPRNYYTSVEGSDTQSIQLFLLSNLDSTHQYLEYDIVDQSATILRNATIKMQRYFINESTWKTVEMSKSNDNGKGFLFAELYDVNYRFVIEYPTGTTRKITTQTYLNTQDLFFTLSLLDSGLTNHYQSGDVATILTYSNTTKVWTYSFNGASLTDVESGRFLVLKKTGNAISTICNSTVSSSSGGMTCNLTSYSTDDSLFTAQGYVTFTDDTEEYLVESNSLQVVSNYLKYGLNGVYLSFIVIGTLTMIGLFSPITAIIMAVFGLILTIALGILYLSYVWLIGIIIVALIYVFSMER